MTTGSRDLDEAGAALKRMLGDEPASRVLGCRSWSRARVNAGKNLMTPERPGEQDEVGYRRDRLGVRVGGPTVRISDRS